MQAKVSKGERVVLGTSRHNRLKTAVKQLSTEKMSGAKEWCTHTLESGSYGANA